MVSPVTAPGRMNPGMNENAGMAGMNAGMYGGNGMNGMNTSGVSQTFNGRAKQPEVTT